MENQTAAAFIINSKLCERLNIQVEIDKSEDRFVPQVRVYHDKTHDPRKCSFVCLHKAEYCTLHADAPVLPSALKDEFIAVMTSYVDTSEGGKLTGYEMSVGFWVDTYGKKCGEYSFDDKDEHVMPDYTRLKTSKGKITFKTSLKNFVVNIGSKGEIYDPNLLMRLPLCAFRGSPVKKVIIHSHLTHIGQRAFQGCVNLKEIILPDTLEIIETGAFANCKSLEKIHLPDNVREIGDCAFVNCPLKEITLPKNLQVLDFNIFRGCRSMEKAYLPDGIKEIKLSQKLFENCDSLKEISVCADCMIESGALPENCRVIYRKEQNA